MELEPFVAKTVLPGEPVTAQGWNEIVVAIAAIVQYLQTTQASAVRVAIGNADLDPASARVTATAASGAAFQAVRPIPPDTHFIFSGLPPGPYTVRAEAPGFNAATTSITVPVAGAVSISLERAGSFMPLVFGQELAAGLAQLRNANIAVSRVIDVAGRDVPPANPGPEYTDSPVLMQFPAPGQVVGPGASAQLIVAAALEVEAAVEMPPLAGLTLAEAQRALEGLGLVLGRVVTKRSQQG